MAKLTESQMFALNHYLTEYPNDMDFEHLILGIQEGHEEIVICNPYEDITRDWIANEIQALTRQFKNFYDSGWNDCATSSLVTKK